MVHNPSILSPHFFFTVFHSIFLLQDISTFIKLSATLKTDGENFHFLHVLVSEYYDMLYYFPCICLCYVIFKLIKNNQLRKHITIL